MVISILRSFRQDMRTAKTRLVLTMLAIAWATATITFMLSVGEGLRASLGAVASNAGKPFLVVSGGVTSSSRQGQTINQPVTITEEDFRNIKQAFPHIKIIPEYTFSAKSRYLDKTDNQEVSAVYPEYATLRNVAVQPGGRFIDELDIQANRHVIVLGADVAKKLAAATDQPTSLVGKTIFIDQQPFQIIGISTKKLGMIAYQMPDDYRAWVPASTYIIDKRPAEISHLLVFYPGQSSTSSLQKQLTSLIARYNGVDPQDETILTIIDIHKIQQEMRVALNGTEIFLGIVGAMTLVVAGVGVANVMFISVKRATREIGIRMAVGARAWQILWHYIVEALVTTFIGGVIGISFAVLLVWAVKQIPIDNEMFQFVGKPMPVLSGLVMVVVIITLGITGLLAGFFPAWRAANVNPVEALRHE